MSKPCLQDEIQVRIVLSTECGNCGEPFDAELDESEGPITPERIETAERELSQKLHRDGSIFYGYIEDLEGWFCGYCFQEAGRLRQKHSMFSKDAYLVTDDQKDP